nr:12552_t:CDS:2 [Entrophospora candida]
MDYTRCYYKLLDSQMYQMFPEIILERLINKSLKHDNISSSSKELFIIFNILLLAGKEDSKIFKMIINKKSFNFIDKLKKVIYHQKEEEGRELQLITIKLFFEICSVQPLSQTELGMIDEYLLNHLLDLVEITRDEEDETFNYSIIRLILSFNEQFMLSKKCNNNIVEEEETLNPNTVIRVLSKRIGTSETFGENIIFMLNRSVKPHIQMLILKLLYEIFTTPETFEYFYTNDLRVLIDVFIRELYDLPDESEAVRHTYLRVLYPLISNTQLNRDYYKQNQIYKLLLDLNGTSTKNFKPVSPTTQRLVDRCLFTDYLKGISPNTNNNNNHNHSISINNNSSGSINNISSNDIKNYNKYYYQNHEEEIRLVPTPNALMIGMDKSDSIVVVNNDNIVINSINSINNNNVNNVNNVASHQELLLTN